MSLFPDVDFDDDDTTLENHPSDPAAPISLNLVVRDREVLSELVAHAEGAPRNQFALDALRIGVLALRHASSRMDAEVIQNASTQLIDRLQKELDTHAAKTQQRTSDVLKQYFDPRDGRLTERLQRLLCDDGELARVFEAQLHGEGSPLAKRLNEVLGPLLKQLDPGQTEGLLATLRRTVDAELAKQREHLLSEFSLDNQQGALCKLVRELTGKHGDLSKDLQGKIDEVVKEFDLNKEDSALKRLVTNMETAQRTIASEFSLDNTDSSLTRLKEHLSTILSAQVKTNQEFQIEVRETLAKLTQKRESDARSPEHGNLFEDAVVAFVLDYGQRSGDVAMATGATTGQIRNCKVGDAVLELGPDCHGAGNCIVIEAKGNRGYSPAKAREELETARKNRQADFGVFVFSPQAAETVLSRPLARYRNDVLVVWNPEDAATDAYLVAAMEIARACVIEYSRGKKSVEFDTDGIDRAINEIEKRAQNLEKIKKPAETIKSSSETILDRVRIDQQALERQVALLREKLTALHALDQQGG